MARQSEMTRKTGETDIAVNLDLDGSADYKIDTGIGFFDHMLSAFAKHGGFTLNLTCKGDLLVDKHHTVEDCGIVLGAAFAAAAEDKKGICRFGSAFVPMDEALVFAAADISGRPFLCYDDKGLSAQYMEGFDAALTEEFFRAFAFNAGITLHIRVEYGKNPHHMIEAMFKAAARALREALRKSGDALPTTKGVL